MATPRKTLAETKAEYRSLGYQEAFNAIREAWRDRWWDIHNRSGVKAANQDEIQKALWKIIEPMDRRASELNDKHKNLLMPRLGGGTRRLDNE